MGRAVKRRAHPEDDLQRACCKILGMLENQGKLRYFHCPNGGARHPVEAAIFKGIGVRAGIPDLIILPINGQAGFIELKVGKNILTESQADWAKWLTQHYRHAVCRSVDEMLGVLKAWGV